ncbi:MAG: radical SAM protein [Elusimicrobia bacterium]|nr:radical SAM protein [Candidatus Liberimonas magnetica]
MNIRYLIKKYNYKLIELQKRLRTQIVIGYPYWLTIDPSNICNLKCVFCPTGQRRGTRVQATLSFNDYKKIIDKLGPYLFHIDFCNWGEPLLNKDISRMITYTKERFSPEIKLDTNLNVELSKDDAVALIKSGVDWISASIDGASQEVYEIYRRDGNFEKALSNLKLLVKVKKDLNKEIPHIHWQFLVFKHNEHEIDKAKAMAKEIGVDSIGFTAPFCSPEWVSNKDEFNRYKVVEDKIEFKPVEQICGWLWDGITINADGSVSPCCSVEDQKDDFYEFFKKPFWMIWNGKKYRVARKFVKDRTKPKENNVCTNCDHIGVSNHAKISID